MDGILMVYKIIISFHLAIIYFIWAVALTLNFICDICSVFSECRWSFMAGNFQLNKGLFYTALLRPAWPSRTVKPALSGLRPRPDASHRKPPKRRISLFPFSQRLAAWIPDLFVSYQKSALVHQRQCCHQFNCIQFNSIPTLINSILSWIELTKLAISEQIDE
jgi:hypothetical protein